MWDPLNWTVPPLPGLQAGITAFGHFAPAPPTNDGAGLYSVEAGSNDTYALRALTTDGRQLWQQPLSTTVIGPDLYGGVLVGARAIPPDSKTSMAKPVHLYGSVTLQAHQLRCGRTEMLLGSGGMHNSFSSHRRTH